MQRLLGTVAALADRHIFVFRVSEVFSVNMKG